MVGRRGGLEGRGGGRQEKVDRGEASAVNVGNGGVEDVEDVGDSAGDDGSGSGREVDSGSVGM